MKRSLPMECFHLQLTPKESQIFGLLKDTISATPSLSGMTIRAAGGWVRDKCLGKDSDDIDIAVDRGTGEDFAHAVKAYADSLPVHDGEKKIVSSVGAVAVNPEQSKHLATAFLSVYGWHLDISNLRSEEYTESSRIPTIRVGTPEEDAFRRDLTINALFYNINEDRVEDLTGRGFDDLKNKICRTPMEPVQTFRDDPLRMLRAVRFASRYDFKLDDRIVEATRMKELHESFAKLSRERVGDEIVKIFAHSVVPCCRALHLLRTCDLGEIVFQARTLCGKAVVEQDEVAVQEAFPGLLAPLTTADFLDSERSNDLGSAQNTWWQRGMDAVCALESLFFQRRPDLDKKEELLMTLRFSAFLSPFSGLAVPEKKGKFSPALSKVLREGLKKLSNSVTADIEGFAKAAETLKKVICSENEAWTTSDAVTAGWVLRDKKVAARWEHVLLLTEALALAEKLRKEAKLETLDAETVTASQSGERSTQQQRCVRTSFPGDPFARFDSVRMDEPEDTSLAFRFAAFKTWVREHGLVAPDSPPCWEWKPCFSGDELQKDFRLPRGPLLGDMVTFQLTERMRNPRILKEEMAELIRKKMEEV